MSAYHNTPFVTTPGAYLARDHECVVVRVDHRGHRHEFPVEVACGVLRVSRGGFYARDRRPPGPAEDRRGEILEQIRQVHRESRRTYGSPRVHRALVARDVRCRENTVAKLMRGQSIRSKAAQPFVVRTTDSRHDRPVAENLMDRAIYPDRPDEVWTADITYIPTAEGWLDLAVVLDLCSRRVVGRATADHLRAELTCDALRMAQGIAGPGGSCSTTSTGACGTPATLADPTKSIPVVRIGAVDRSRLKVSAIGPGEVAGGGGWRGTSCSSDGDGARPRIGRKAEDRGRCGGR